LYLGALFKQAPESIEENLYPMADSGRPNRLNLTVSGGVAFQESG
jgi:hypothetical protein